MDEEKYLIILKGDDRTSEISSYDKTDSRVQIQFKSSTQVYFYNLSDVLILKEPRVLEITEDIVIFKDGFPFNNVQRVLDFGPKIKVYFKNGSNRLYDRENIQIKRNGIQGSNAEKILNYWKAISKHVKSGEETEDQEGFITKEFAKLNYVHPDSVLNHYINAKSIKDDEDRFSSEPIFPFSYNLSQKKALEQALRSKISIIQGPPGTGKTQTILNILANLMLQQKKVAVVSGNNSAVQNVGEKLEREGYHFFVAGLGRRENKERFFSKLPNRNVVGWKSDETESELQIKVRDLDSQITQLMEIHRETAQLKQELSAYLLEQEHFEHFFNKQGTQHFEKLSLYRQTPDKVLEFMKDSFLSVEMKKGNKLLFMFKLFFKHGFINLKAIRDQELDVILNFQRKFYELKIEELSEKITVLEEELSSQSYQELIEQHQKYSEKLFRNKLYDMYQNRTFVEYRANTYRRNNNFKSFIEDYPFILSTTHSLRNCAPTNFLFDYCIIDESSQVDLLSGVLALSCCKQAIVVGDTKQLPQIVDQDIKKIIKDDLSVNSDSPYNYFNHNLLSSMMSLYGDSIPQVMLREHYRCHPKIIEFCNRKYYDGELITFTTESDSDFPLAIYRTAPGNHMRELTHYQKGKFNQRELEVIEREVLLGLAEVSASHEDVGIVTPYRKQVEKASKQFSSEIESDTIHKYQGREKPIMIMTSVLDKTKSGKKGMKFVNDPCKINVAVSRAQNKFILVTDQSAFRKYGNEVGDLMRYMEYSTLDDNVVESEVISVFDLLYKEYSDKLRSFRDKVKLFNRERHRSENIMHALLDGILQDPKFRNFELSNQVFLMNLFPNLDRLEEDERKFIRHRSSVDFVIYYKLDRSPVFAIEVDGFAFHENKPEQLERDKRKERIFKKFGLDLHRFRTNESDEERRLRELLDSEISKRVDK
ncbi:AAA domain-containing protein [Paenibacillus sp. GM2]|uniref:AAA domain-containing protein n=1 Tax=Paenibacillus sp. GM2 TaxID=1622070 RepID=UPI000837FCAA|nr:AAA domain-containing protein [Paenibacillus sp. GM2]